MRFHHLCLSAGAAALFFVSSAQAELLITIDKSAQQMTVAVDGEQRYVWPVSTGRRGYDTPNGDFKPFRMEKDHYSREWDDAPMPNSIFFTEEGHAIHGTFEARNLGRPVSHGCVRLSRANASTLWDLVKQQKMANTHVVLAGHIPDTAPAVASHRRSLDVAARNRQDFDQPGYPRVYSTDGYSYAPAGTMRMESQGGRYYEYREPGYRRPSFGPFPFPFGSGW